MSIEDTVQSLKVLNRKVEEKFEKAQQTINQMRQALEKASMEAETLRKELELFKKRCEMLEGQLEAGVELDAINKGILPYISNKENNEQT